MAIEAFQLPIISEISERALPSRRCLCLGCPDILSERDWKGLPMSPDAAAIRKWHAWDGDVLDTDAFLRMCDLEPIYIDRAVIRGPEIVLDLNTAELPRDIGLLIDPGTSEHIFNIGHLFQQIVGSVSTGGYVMHTNPLNMENHGFWNFSPTAYKDFYDANGFTIVDAREMTGPLKTRSLRSFNIDNTGWWRERWEAEKNSSAFIVARKVANLPFLWPLQAKYRDNPMLRPGA